MGPEFLLPLHVDVEVEPGRGGLDGEERMGDREERVEHGEEQRKCREHGELQGETPRAHFHKTCDET